MLEKLRSRHPIDVPAEKWGASKGLLTVLGLIALLFVALPLLGALYGVIDQAPAALVVAFAALAAVLLGAALRGKPGHARR